MWTRGDQFYGAENVLFLNTLLLDAWYIIWASNSMPSEQHPIYDTTPKVCFQKMLNVMKMSLEWWPKTKNFPFDQLSRLFKFNIIVDCSKPVHRPTHFSLLLLYFFGTKIIYFLHFSFPMYYRSMSWNEFSPQNE